MYPRCIGTDTDLNCDTQEVMYCWVGKPRKILCIIIPSHSWCVAQQCLLLKFYISTAVQTGLLMCLYALPYVRVSYTVTKTEGQDFKVHVISFGVGLAFIFFVSPFLRQTLIRSQP